MVKSWQARSDCERHDPRFVAMTTAVEETTAAEETLRKKYTLLLAPGMPSSGQRCTCTSSINFGSIPEWDRGRMVLH